MAITEHYLGRTFTVEDLNTDMRLINPFFGNGLLSGERWPEMVRYDERGTFFVPRDRYAFNPRNPRCSDCVMIVPGSTP